MTPRKISKFGLLMFLVFVAILGASEGQPAQLLDDRAVTVHSAREIAAKRRALVQYIWGADGFPDRRLPAVQTNVPSPVQTTQPPFACG
jgi:hypothetical protein